MNSFPVFNALIEKKQNFLINSSLLGTTPITTSLCSCAAALSVLFTAVKPEASMGLDLIARFSFWVTHITIGLLAILLASKLIQRITIRRLPLIVSVLLTGIIGAAISAPAYSLLDTLFPAAYSSDNLAQEIQQHGVLAVVGSEFLACLPAFMTIWVIVNVPLIFSNRQHTTSATAPLNAPASTSASSPATASACTPAAIPVGIPAANTIIVQEINPETVKRAALREQFLDSLPTVLGRELVVIFSDLHYLNVHTTQGKCLVLGSLSRCAEFLSGEGMQVHRSSWVAKQHVTRAQVSGNNAHCVMSTGIKVPISRSRRKAVKEYFGAAIQHCADEISFNNKNSLVKREEKQAAR